MTLKNLSFFVLFIIFLNCKKEQTVISVIDCLNSTLQISQSDSIAIPSATDPVLWTGTYTNNTVQINFTKIISSDGETEKVSFIFNKTSNCLEISHAYKFYDGKLVDVSAVTEMEVLKFEAQDWEIDKKLTGEITYIDPHNQNVYTRKFWVELTTNDFTVEPTDFQLFSDCFSTKLPIDIDMNNDGIIDFNLGYEEIRNLGNKPAFSEYTFKLSSNNTSNNFILSPIRNGSPYFVIFEPPFSSENTNQYFNGVKNSLDIFYEFDFPYQKYNYLLNNNLTYSRTLNNNLDDYFVVSMILNGNRYYGWIKFKFISTSCTIEVLDTFLNPNAFEHINVN